MTSASAAVNNAQPWWKYGYVWLVISGPAVVVVAGFYTLLLAISSPNQVLTDGTDRPKAEITPKAESKEMIFTPALKGRNHAATPISDRPSD